MWKIQQFLSSTKTCTQKKIGSFFSASRCLVNHLSKLHQTVHAAYCLWPWLDVAIRYVVPVLCCPMNRLVKVHTKDRVCYLANKNKKLSPRDRAMRRVSWNSSREWWHCPWSWVPPNYSKSPHFLHFAPPFIASWRVNLGSSNLGTLIYYSKSHPADGKSFLKVAWSGSGEPF